MIFTLVLFLIGILNSYLRENMIFEIISNEIILLAILFLALVIFRNDFIYHSPYLSPNLTIVRFALALFSVDFFLIYLGQVLFTEWRVLVRHFMQSLGSVVSGFFW